MCLCINLENSKVTLFPYDGWVWRAKRRFGPVLGVPEPKCVLENGWKRPKATGWNSVAGPLMNPENPKGKTEISVALRSSILFFLWVAPIGPFWLIWLKNTNLAATVKPQMKMGPTKVDYWSAMWDGKRGRIRYASKNRTHGQVVWKFHYFQQKVWDKEGEIILILIWFVYDSIFWGGRQFSFTWDEYILAQYQLESHLFYY